MAYLTIKNAWVAEDAMITSGLLGQMRDNITALHDDTTAFAFKSGDQSVVASTALENDDDLFFTVGALETWHVRLVCEFTDDATGNLKIALTMPSTPGGEEGYIIGVDRSGFNPGTGSQTTLDGEVSGTPVVSALARTNGVLVADVFVLSGVTGGTARLQWAQNVANGTTTLHENSFLRAQRVDVIDVGAAYSEIASTDVDGKSPLETGLGEQIRDNPIALYQARAFVNKTADETVTNSTALQDDDVLTFAVGANEVWMYELRLLVSALNVADLKVQITGPAGATGAWGGFNTSQAAGAEPFSVTAPFGVVGAASALDNIDNIGALPVVLTGFMVTAGTAGDATLQWAQNTANAVGTTIHEHSFLVAHRVDAVAPGGATLTVIPDTDIDPESDIDDATNVIAELANNAPAVYNTTRAFVAKAGGETVNNSTTLQDDDDLTFSIGANETWAFLVLLDIVTPNAAGFKYQVTTPDGGDAGYVMGFRSVGGSGVAGNVGDHKGTINAAVGFAIGGAGVAPQVWIEGWASTGATAGTVQLEWAQNAAVVGDTTVNANSFLYARRLDDL